MKYLELITNDIEEQIFLTFLSKQQIKNFNGFIMQFKNYLKSNILVICLDFESIEFTNKNKYKNFLLFDPKIAENNNKKLKIILQIIEITKKKILYIDNSLKIKNNLFDFLLTEKNYDLILDYNNSSILDSFHSSLSLIKMDCSFYLKYRAKDNNYFDDIEKFVNQNKKLITDSCNTFLNYELFLEDNNVIGLINLNDYRL